MDKKYKSRGHGSSKNIELVNLGYDTERTKSGKKVTRHKLTISG